MARVLRKELVTGWWICLIKDFCSRHLMTDQQIYIADVPYNVGSNFYGSNPDAERICDEICQKIYNLRMELTKSNDETVGEENEH